MKSSLGRRLCIPLLVMALGTAALWSQTAEPEPTTGTTYDQLLPYVRAYIYMNRIERAGRSFVGPAIAAAEINGLHRLSFDPDAATAERVRQAIQRDRQRYKLEYGVRGRVAQTLGATRDDRNENGYQEELWRVFLDDPRWVCRVVDELRVAAPGDLCPPPAPETDRGDVRRLLAGLDEALRDLVGEEGCNASQLVAIGAVAESDPALIAAVFEMYVGRQPGDVGLDEAVRGLGDRGWVVGD